MVVDAGGLFNRGPVLPPDQIADHEAKAGLIAEAYALGGIDALLPARGDFAVGRGVLESLGERHGLPYVLSNVVCADALPWPSTRRFEVGGVAVVVYGIVDAELSVEGCQVRDPASLLGTLPVDDTVYIVLSDQKRARDEALAARAPGIDFIVNGEGMESLASPAPLDNGGLFLASGTRGKLLGLAEVRPEAGARAWLDTGAGAARAEDLEAAKAKLAELAERKAAAEDDRARGRIARQEEFWKKKEEKATAALATAAEAGALTSKVRNELRPLGATVGEHAPTAALVGTFKTTHSGAASGPPAESATAPQEGGFGPFVGSSACAACHPTQHKQWAGTGHAHAWTSLVGQERQYDTDCYTCHVTGATDRDGPKDPRQLGGLENVGCEACHGAGRAHAADPAQARLVRSPPTTQCVVCHDSRQDGGRFEEAGYRAKVKH